MKYDELTKAQWKAIEWAKDHHGRISGGRFGFNTRTLTALKKRGLLRMVSKTVWDSEWRMTETARKLFGVGTKS